MADDAGLDRGGRRAGGAHHRALGGPGEVGPDDNRTGLALLIELAEIWPKSARGRVNPCFLAVGGPRDTLIAAPTDLGSATLLIEIVNPGRGHQLAIAGTPVERENAWKAAEELWTPHVPLPRFPIRDSVSPRLLISGVGHPDDPAASGRAAQLVIEIALRWGKRHAAGTAAPV